MSGALANVYLVRHGETAWAISGQHTGRTDIPLTEQGEHDAQALGARLKGMSFIQVLTSPLQRALRTAELAGFGDRAQPDPDLMEWNYGTYEGRRTAEIRAERPGWRLFKDGWLLFSTPGLGAFISGDILFEETLNAEYCGRRDVVPASDSAGHCARHQGG